MERIFSTDRKRNEINMLTTDMDDLEDAAEISASEDEDGDDRNHMKLLDAISSLDGKKKVRLHERTVHAAQISEFNFTPQNESNKVNISELMGTLKSGSQAKIKKQLKSVEDSDKVVAVPLPRREKERIDRSVAYDQTSEVFNKWDSIVTKNRQADQLQFPLDRPILKLHTTDQQAKTIKPRTSLEIEVAALLKNSDNVPSRSKELTPAEERALQAMDLQEARERLSELRKHRALLSYKEAKARWQKRIKSKKYHRVLRKEKMKNEKKSLEELEKTDPEAYAEKLMAVDKQRIEERMSLKHRGGSKYMKKQIIYGKYDDQARQAVQEMIQKNKELTQKTEVFSESESEGGVSMDSEDEMNMLESANNPWMKSSKLSKPTGYEPIKEVITEDQIKLPSDSENENESKIQLTNVVEKVVIEDKNMTDKIVETNKASKNNIEKEIESPTNSKKERKLSNKKAFTKNSLSNVDNIDDLFKDFETQKNGDKAAVTPTSIHEKVMSGETRQKKRNRQKREKERKKKHLQEEQKKEAEEKKNESEEEEESVISETLARKSTMEDFEGNISEDEAGSDIRRRSRKPDESEAEHGGKQFEKQENVYVDPRKLLTLESKIDKSGMPDMIVDNNDIDEDQQQRMTIAQAFADDDVVEEFSQEKAKVINRDKPKDIDLTLPGWGEWGGEGVKMSKRKKKRFIIKAPPAEPRKDSNLGNVIISEQKDKAIAKYQVSDLPFPFLNVKQFEQSIRAPVGKTWNPETAYKQLVKPKIVTKLGTIISPIDKEETFKKENNKRRADFDFKTPPAVENNSRNKKKRRR